MTPYLCCIWSFCIGYFSFSTWQCRKMRMWWFHMICLVGFPPSPTLCLFRNLLNHIPVTRTEQRNISKLILSVISLTFYILMRKAKKKYSDHVIKRDYRPNIFIKWGNWICKLNSSHLASQLCEASVIAISHRCRNWGSDLTGEAENQSGHRVSKLTNIR